MPFFGNDDARISISSKDRTPTTLTVYFLNVTSPTPTLLKIVRGNPGKRRIDLREPRWPRWQSATLQAAPLMVTTGTGSLMQNPMPRVALSANSYCLISFSSRRFFVSLRPPATSDFTAKLWI